MPGRKLNCNHSTICSVHGGGEQALSSVAASATAAFEVAEINGGGGGSCGAPVVVAPRGMGEEGRRAPKNGDPDRVKGR